MYNKTLFGTDGIRRTFGIEPLTDSGLLYLGQALSKWLIFKYGQNPQVFISYDTRLSCKEIFGSLYEKFSQNNIGVHKGPILPTPALARIVYANNTYDAGIMITASHNTYLDNGLKIFDANGDKISSEDEQIINNLFYKENNSCYHLIDEARNGLKSGLVGKLRHNFVTPIPNLKSEVLPTDNKNKIKLDNLEHIVLDSENRYIQLLKELADLSNNNFKNIKVVIDSANGALYSVALKFFKNLGAQITLINSNPDGTNINKNCGALYPEELQTAVKNIGADIGFAFDGDGDRIIIVNSKGDLRNGDDVLALLSTCSLFNNFKHIIGTTMTNLGLENYLLANNKKLIRTDVGDKNIANYLKILNNAIGGEPSGHILLPYKPYTSDALLAAAIVTKIAIENNNFELTTFNHYPQINLALPIKTKIDLECYDVQEAINKSKKILPNGRIAVRYSGTEPVLRIMGEAKDQNLLNVIIQELAQDLNKFHN